MNWSAGYRSIGCMSFLGMGQCGECQKPKRKCTGRLVTQIRKLEAKLEMLRRVQALVVQLGGQTAAALAAGDYDTARELHARQLSMVGVGAKAAVYSAGECREAGFSIKQLQQAGCKLSMGDVKAAGYTHIAANPNKACAGGGLGSIV